MEVPGLDAIGIGRFDLAQSLGYEGQMDHPDVVGALETMTRKARERGIDTIAAD